MAITSPTPGYRGLQDGHAPGAGLSQRYWPPAELIRKPPEEAAHIVEGVEIMEDPFQASKGRIHLYRCVGQHGQEAEPTLAAGGVQPYQVNQTLLAAAKTDDAGDALPTAHRGEEITAEVIDGPQSIVFGPRENRLHTQKAVLSFYEQRGETVI